jgi:hypothetical protein
MMMSDVVWSAFHGVAGAARAGSLYDGVWGCAGGKMDDMTDAACCCSCWVELYNVADLESGCGAAPVSCSVRGRG